MHKYYERAKDILKKKHIMNPKPQKRFARIVEKDGESEEEEEEKVTEEFRVPAAPITKPLEDYTVPLDASLRPVRSAKTNANKNLVS